MSTMHESYTTMHESYVVYAVYPFIIGSWEDQKGMLQLMIFVINQKFFSKYNSV